MGLRHRTSRSASHAQPPTSSAKPTIRRVGARSARPCPSLTVTLIIDVAHHDRRRGRNGREAPPSRVTSVLTDGVGRPPPGAGHSPTLIRFLARKASWHEQDPPTATPPHQRIRHFRCCLVASPGARKNSASWWRAGAVGGGGHEELSPPRTRRWRGRDLNVDHQRRAGVAWNEMGITRARVRALVLSPARLCAGLICANAGTAWWRGCGCFPGGQGVAGSNPAVPTQVRGLIDNLALTLGTTLIPVVWSGAP